MALSLSHKHSIDTIYTKIRVYDDINVKYSFHPLNATRKTDVNFKLPIDKDKIEKVWKRKSVFSRIEPDIELIIEYGKRLHVDIVLIIYANGADYYCEIDSYLIDTNSKKFFHSNEHDIKHESYYPILAQGTTEVIEQFLQNR